MNPSDFVAYTISIVALSLTPGASVVFVVSAAFSNYKKNIPWIIMGLTLANILWILVASSVRSIGLVLPDQVQAVLPILGSVSLVLIAVKLGVQTLLGEQALGTDDLRMSMRRSGFINGLIVHASNPNTFVFYISIFLSLVKVDEEYVRNVSILGTIAVTVDIVILTIFALMALTLADPVRRAISILRKSPLVAAVSLFYLGIKNLINGIETIFWG